MPHLKKDFKFHKIFGNKYADQSYIAYLCKDKRKYILNSGDYVDSFVIITIDFIFKINNAIARRGLVENNIKEIEKLYNEPFQVQSYINYSNETITILYNNTCKKYFTNDKMIEILDMLGKIVSWKDKFKDNYEEFKDFIFDLVKYIDDNHYTWLVGENVIYNRSIRDNADKKIYCAVIGTKQYEKFKIIYSRKVYVEKKYINLLIDEISCLLITISDVYNEINFKNYDIAVELLTNYLQDNKKMVKCKDIYYAKIYNDLYILLKQIKDKKYTDVLRFIKEIISNENRKYEKDIIMFEKISVDESTIESENYIEL